MVHLEGHLLLVCAPCYGRGGGGGEKEKRVFPRSKGDQAELQPSCSVDDLILREDFKPDASDIVGGAHQQRCALAGYASHGGGRRAVSSGGYAAHCSSQKVVLLLPSLLLVKGRPFFFLPAHVTEGRQRFFLAASMVSFHGSFVIPSGVVPRGEEVLMREESLPLLCSSSLFDIFRFANQTTFAPLPKTWRNHKLNMTVDQLPYATHIPVCYFPCERCLKHFYRRLLTELRNA